MPATAAKRTNKRSSRRAAAKTATPRKRKLTQAQRQAIYRANAARARAVKAERAAQRQAGGVESPPPPVDYGDLSPMGVARGIAAYLELCIANATGEGRRQTRRQDPAKVKARIAKLEAEARQAPGAIKMLKIQNKLLQLRATTGQNGDGAASAEAFFVKYGAAYAQREHIAYGAFRTIGVPASVLKQAGIQQ